MRQCYTGTSGGGQTCFSDTAADDPGDSIFLFSGNYTGGFTLANNQRLIGQGATDTLANIAGVTVPTFSDPLPATGGASPVITTTVAATVAVPLGSGNHLRGFTVGNTAGAKIFGNNFGTLTVGNNATPDVILSGSGRALGLTNGTFAATSGFASVATTSSIAASRSRTTRQAHAPSALSVCPAVLGAASFMGRAGANFCNDLARFLTDRSERRTLGRVRSPVLWSNR